MAESEKPLFWIASSKDDLDDFPPEVQDVMGYALDLAQRGKKHSDAKPLKGHKGAGVLEVVDDFDGDTYRAVYTVKLEGPSMCFTRSRKRRRRASQRQRPIFKKLKRD